MTQKTKAELAAELNRYLLVQVDWERLSIEDLLKLFDAFERLRIDVESVFGLLDEALSQTPTIVQDSKKERQNYVI